MGSVWRARDEVLDRPVVQKQLTVSAARVIALFDASAIAIDGKPYDDNTYTWYMRLRAGAIVEAIAFFDTIEFTDLWTRVTPTPPGRTAQIP